MRPSACANEMTPNLARNSFALAEPTLGSNRRERELCRHNRHLVFIEESILSAHV